MHFRVLIEKQRNDFLLKAVLFFFTTYIGQGFVPQSFKNQKKINPLKINTHILSLSWN